MKNVKYKFKTLDLSADANETTGNESMFRIGKFFGVAAGLIMFGFLIGLGIHLAGGLFG